MQEEDLKVVVNKKNIVEMDNISKVYDKHTWALKKVNLSISKGECISIVGSNGSGKTTLLRILANNLESTTGTIRYNFSEENILKAIGFQKREQAWPAGFKVKHINNLWANIFAVEDLEWLSKLKDVFGVTSIENKYLSKLSMVKLQLYGIFLAFISKPELVVIDQLSSDVDFKYEEKIANFIKEYIDMGNTVILNYPSYYFLENITSRIIYLNDGEIFEDKPIENIKKEYSSVSEYTKSILKEELIFEKRIKNKSKLFITINAKLEESIKVIQTIIEELEPNHLKENKMLTSIQNAYKAVLDLETSINNLSVSYISSELIQKISKKIKITVKSFDKIHLTSSYKRYEKTFESIKKYLNKELKKTFNNEMIVVNGDAISASISDKEKKQLEKLKEKYIKEELKTIRKKILKQQLKKAK